MSQPCSSGVADASASAIVPLDADASASAIVPLDGGSLLNSLSDDLLYSVLLSLPARSLALALCVSSSLRDSVVAMLPRLLRERGLAEGTPLSRLHRSESAIMHEAWATGGGWSDQWKLGPSAPPTDGQASYAKRGVRQVRTPQDPAPVFSGVCTPFGAGQRALPELEPGCRVQVRRGGLKMRNSSSAFGKLLDALLVARHEAVPADAPFEGTFLVLKALPPPETKGSSHGVWQVMALGDSRQEPLFGDTFEVRTEHMRLLAHPLEGLAEPCSPQNYLELRGGWRMNFSGVYRPLGPPCHPSRVTFTYRVLSRCSSRSFFNAFFSSVELPYADLASFWAGSRHMAPSPRDTFSILIDVSSSNQLEQGMMWLPSGANLSLPHPARPSTAGPSCAPADEWHTVVLEFDWTHMRVIPCIDGVMLGEIGDLSFPFGPHPKATPHPAYVEELAHKFPNMTVAELNRDVMENKRRSDAALLAGFRHLYFFTWLEDSRERDAPEVQVGDVWLEHEQPPRAPQLQGSSMDMEGVMTVGPVPGPPPPVPLGEGWAAENENSDDSSGSSMDEQEAEFADDSDE